MPEAVRQQMEDEPPLVAKLITVLTEGTTAPLSSVDALVHMWELLRFAWHNNTLNGRQLLSKLQHRTRYLEFHGISDPYQL